jgi:hypothetical protein
MRRLFSVLRSHRFPLLSTWGAVALIAALACQPLLGLPPKGHDAFLHYFRIPAVSTLWQHGLFFSRWVPDLVYGYGSPLFNFYPPLSAYLLTGLYWLVGQDGLLAYNLAFALALTLSALSMFLLGQHLYGRTGGLLATAAYTLSPHVLQQSYSRGSLSNALALAVVPLAALGLLRLAHTAAGLLFLPTLLLFGLVASFLLYRSRSVPVIVALLLALALAAFAWLPGLAEIDATHYATAVATDKVILGQNFAAVLAWPPLTIAGLSNPPLPRNIGLVQLLLAVAATVMATWQAWQNPRGQPDRRLAAFVSLVGLLGLSVLFFTTPLATWFWREVELLRQLQFPWRLLDLPAFFLALTAGWWGTVRLGRWRPVLLGVAFVGIFLNALPYLYPARLASLPAQPSLRDVTRVQQERGILGLTAWGEYSSEQVGKWPGGPAFPGADQAASLATKLSLPASVALRSARGGLLHATWELSTPKATPVVLAVHDFPGWQAEVDGSATTIVADELGRIRIQVPAGNHTLSVRWGRTPVRWLADGLSLLALALVAWLAWRRRDRSPARPLPPSSGSSWWLFAVLAALLVAKIAWFDRRDTPLVVHPHGERIPGTNIAEYGDFGVFRLAGYELAEPDRLILYWYAPDRVEERYTIRVTLVDARGVPVQEIYHTHPGDDVTTSWEAGQLTRDIYDLPIRKRRPPVAYRLSVAVLEAATEEPLLLKGTPGATASVGVGTLKRAPQPAPIPAQARPVNTVFGEAIELSHALVPEKVNGDESLPLILYWRCHARVADDYTVFVHLLQPDGAFVAAYDSQPLDGLYPTSFWAAGEMVVDMRTITLDAPPGEYLLQVGLYDLESGARLPVSGKHAELGDRVLLQSLEIDSEPSPPQYGANNP